MVNNHCNAAQIWSRVRYNQYLSYTTDPAIYVILFAGAERFNEQVMTSEPENTKKATKFADKIF